MRTWLMKSEPDVYGWPKLVEDGKGRWDGVRNPRAANNLRAMSVGDRVFFYHSNIGKEIVGVMEVTKTAYPDPTDDTGKWVAVDVKPVMPVKRPVTLAEVKADPKYADFELVKYSRLSVMPVAPEHWKSICKLAGIPA
jgi:predicted RNA-binding protein with PUA-like domain